VSPHALRPRLSRTSTNSSDPSLAETTHANAEGKLGCSADAWCRRRFLWSSVHVKRDPGGGDEHAPRRGGTQPSVRGRPRPGATASRDTRDGATASARRHLYSRFGGRHGRAHRPAARSWGIRGQLDAGHPGTGENPSGSRPRPAGSRCLGDDRRQARRQPRVRVAERANRADVLVAACYRRALAGGRDRGPFRQRPRQHAQ
jgi:hypothetical protein